MLLEFYVEDQPAKTQSKGRLKIEATQIDLPPEIVVVPKDQVFKIKENQTINIRFYLSDPNGDDDIQEFDFLTDNKQISKSSLIKNTSNQYEFTWHPNYDFVKDPFDSLGFNIDFFVLDKTKKRDVKTIRFALYYCVTTGYGNVVDSYLAFMATTKLEFILVLCNS
jgi:hypothetical protein